MPVELSIIKQAPIALYRCPPQGGHITEDHSWTVALGKNMGNAAMFGLLSKRHPGHLTYMSFFVRKLIPFRTLVQHTRAHGDRFYFCRSRVTSHIWATSDELERVFRVFGLIEETASEAALRKHILAEHGVVLLPTTSIRELAGRHAEMHSAIAKEWVC